MNDNLSTLDAVNPSVFTTHESSIISTALGIIEERCLRTGPVLFYLEDFRRYLVMRFAGLVNEQGHVLYLDVNRRLLSADTEFFGDQTSVTWDMRKIVSKAIALGAKHLVYAHNHPGDNPTPSDRDIEHLNAASWVLNHLNINLLDSYVVTHRGITSIRAHKEEMEAQRTQEVLERRDREDNEKRARRVANKAAKLAAQRAMQTAAA